MLIGLLYCHFPLFYSQFYLLDQISSQTGLTEKRNPDKSAPEGPVLSEFILNVLASHTLTGNFQHVHTVKPVLRAGLPLNIRFKIP